MYYARFRLFEGTANDGKVSSVLLSFCLAVVPTTFASMHMDFHFTRMPELEELEVRAEATARHLSVQTHE